MNNQTCTINRLTCTIRPETHDDYQSIYQLNKTAFGRENEAVLIDKIRDSYNYIPTLSLVAIVNDQIVGYIMFSYIDLINHHTFGVNKMKTLGLAPLAVAPTHQKQGIARQLITTGFQLANERGEPLVVILGEPNFYQKFGCLPAMNYQIASPFNTATEYWMIKPLENYHDLYKGQVNYPEYFDDV
jgi:putative acetyltransferase